MFIQNVYQGELFQVRYATKDVSKLVRKSYIPDPEMANGLL